MRISLVLLALAISGCSSPTKPDTELACYRMGNGETDQYGYRLATDDWVFLAMSDKPIPGCSCVSVGEIP